MRRTLLGSALLTLAAAAACDSEHFDVGLTEPIIGQNSELKHGALPEGPEDRAIITSLERNFGVMQPGAPNLTLSGRTSENAYSVGIRFADLGTGYWVRPVGAPDPTVTEATELTFNFAFQAAYDIEPGNHTLVAVAFDAQGKPGPKYEIPVCVVSDLPDNRNACDPRREPPPTIVSLTWNTDADLDLILESGGVRYDRSNRSELDGDTVLWGLEYDGVSGCLADGRRRENFVFNELPGEGSSFDAYVSFFDACGHAAVSFELTVYRSVQDDDGTFRLEAEPSVRGEFVRAQQSGGVGNPLYLRTIDF